MAKKKPVADDDELDGDTLDEGEAVTVIYDSTMEEISEILSQAYSDIEAKVQGLVDALNDVTCR